MILHKPLSYTLPSYDELLKMKDLSKARFYKKATSIVEKIPEITGLLLVGAYVNSVIFNSCCI